MSHRIHTTATFIFVLAHALLADRARCQTDLTVVRSDERSIILEYRPAFRPSRTIASGKQAYTLQDFEGSVSSHSLENAGRPDIRYRLVPLGFPGQTGNAAVVVAADYQDMKDVRPVPIPRYRSLDGMLETDTYEPRPEEYARTEFQPARVAELAPIERVRSLMVGGLRIYPLQYNPATGVMRKYSRIVVEVTYGAGQGRPFPSEDDALFKDHILNYPAARNWKYGRTGAVAQLPQPSVLASGPWYRLTVQNEGVYRLDAAYLAAIGIDVASLDPRTIRIYGNGGTMVPENITVPRPGDLVENAIIVVGEGDGQFNANDYVLFFGTSTSGWTYVPAGRIHNHYINYYSDVNYYWLTFGGAPGRRMTQQASLPDNPTVSPDWFQDLVFREDEQVNFLSSGKEWFGQSLNPGGGFTYMAILHGLVPGVPLRYRARVALRSSSWGQFTIRESGDSLGSVVLPPVGMGVNDFQYASQGYIDVQPTPPISGETSQLNFSLTPAAATGTGWIGWSEVHYPRRFEAVAGYLRFRSPDTTGIVEYRLAGFPTRPYILNVTDPLNVRQITGDVGSYTIRMAETGGQESEYCAVGTGGYMTPAGAQRMNNQNLHGYTGGAQFIIVTSSEFRQAADRLAAHRSQPAYGGLLTFVAEVDTIYNEFSGGLPDITGIRDFLKYAYDNWTPRPEYVLFFGGASYDYKGISGFKSSYVPTWQSPESIWDITSYSTDDFFLKFAPGDQPWLVSGRISSRSQAEANVVVDKIIGYETQSARDGWSSRMLYVGDDSWTPQGEDGTQHSDAAEILATNYTPNEFEKRKVYIAEYPTVNTAQGRRKPGAYQAIIDEINRGALAVNYSGHGNPTVWAHESIFSVQTSIPQLVNANKLSVFYAATCNFSQFDDLKRYTGSELLMNKPDGGSIAVVSATRKVFAGANAYLHQGIFRHMFSRDQFGRLVVERPAKALFLQKSDQNSLNDQKFFFMGDPTMQLEFPSGYASIDSINTEPVDSVAGLPRTSPIQLKALSKVTVKGTIRTADNRPDNAFNGTVAVTLNDATRIVTIVAFVPAICCDPFGNPYPPVDWSYQAAGGVLYRGENSVNNGVFSATFIVPKDILYADTSSRGRMVAYYTGPDRDGLGYTSKIYVGGTDTTAVPDVRGPDIRLYVDSRSFRPGDMVSDNPTLIVDLADSSGINTSVSGIGHRIEAWINNAPDSRDITEFYTSKVDNFREGTVQYQLRNIPQGKDYVRVRAWDTYNNPSTAETYFEATSTDQLRITDVMNYPNPFAGATSFTFRQNLLTPLTVTIKIYTVAGRLIQSIDAASPGEPFLKIDWDGRDRDGDRLANGVYLYKVVAKTADGRFTSEALGRMAVLK